MKRRATAAPAPADVMGRLSPGAQQVHRAVLAAFTAAGRPPDRLELDRLASLHGSDPQTVLAELVAADLLAFTAQGQVRAAYPFSPAPTAIRVSWDGGPLVWAMCAIDALGMSAMLGCPVTITAAEPETGRSIRITVDGDRARWAPRRTVVFAGAIADVGSLSADRCCGYINFFTTARAARAWARRHPEITGSMLRRDGALRLGIDQFGMFLGRTTSGTPAGGH